MRNVLKTVSGDEKGIWGDKNVVRNSLITKEWSTFAPKNNQFLEDL